jgi:cytosine/adenosine deaminase-related metal-dependent hydrolase
MLDRNHRLRGGRMLDIAAPTAGSRPFRPASRRITRRSRPAGGRLVVPGFVETHLYLDKTCVLDRCRIVEGTVAEPVCAAAASKRSFTAEDVYKSARQGITGGDA